MSQSRLSIMLILRSIDCIHPCWSFRSSVLCFTITDSSITEFSILLKFCSSMSLLLTDLLWSQMKREMRPPIIGATTPECRFTQNVPPSATSETSWCHAVPFQKWSLPTPPRGSVAVVSIHRGPARVGDGATAEETMGSLFS